jgi:helix-turn-helix protein
MIQLEDQLKRINDKVQLLLRQNQQLQKDNEKLNKELADLKEKQVYQSRKLDEYEQQIGILKMAALQLDDTDKKELEKRLNGYIREIDRCIAMLEE